ncbi:hypothetical protein BJF83_17955 [Nocardiopsis sp. CNR-923]|uniref:hypothetical protein n=1 Tax=Nocardiopsis sp. CNR-923 TaxID=1904965 RepID=UPI00095C4D23|nr:hypothetical protein [Nocardiopsis sp. CNR-923]OLT27638.1 hypothetical protein BJF83_17955 [Nocardiopsis sp. CNR-923]
MRRPITTIGVLVSAIALTLASAAPATAAKGTLHLRVEGSDDVRYTDPTDCIALPDDANAVYNKTDARVVQSSAPCGADIEPRVIVYPGKAEHIPPEARSLVVLDQPS